MPTVTDATAQLEKIDRQIITLLRERKELCHELSSADRILLREANEELMGLWLEEAVDSELNEAYIERIATLTMRMCRQSEE